MWECSYGKEPLDIRLCMLRLTAKWWLLVLATLLGALLFGGVYFLTHVVYGPEREYKAESQFYIEYQDAITYEQQYTFYNKETWESLVHTDLFMDYILENMKSEFTREELEEAVSATLLTDVRIVHATVIAKDPETVLDIQKCLEEAFVLFGEKQKEVEEIRVIVSPQNAVLIALDIRTGRAAVLGAVVALVVTFFALYLYVLFDDSIRIPIEFERRYKIPMELLEETKLIAQMEKSVQIEKSVQLEEINGESCLLVRAGDHNGKLIEKTIRDSMKTGKTIQRAILCEGNLKLISNYYKTAKFPWFTNKA